MIRQPALRARGKYVSKSDMVTDALRELITDRQLSPGTSLRRRDLVETVRCELHAGEGGA
jgi:DNA-binding GntR family transcriptional regulator